MKTFRTLKDKILYLKHIREITMVVAIMGVAGTGLYLMQSSKAATSLASSEAEDGAVGTPAEVVDDANASGNKAVRFAEGGSDPASGCASGGVPAPCIGDAGTGASGWGTPVFADEFDGTSLDLGKWAPCWYPESYTGDRCGMMNESDTVKTNVKVEGGNLVLTQSDRDSGALVNSDPDAGAQTGFLMGEGYAEAKVYFPGEGSEVYNWPAWWINGPESGYSDGEIDVAEGLNEMTSNYHYDKGSGHVADNSGAIPGTWVGGWHTYGVDRKAGENIIYFDGVEVRRYPTYDNFAPESLIFNVGTKESRTMKYGAESQVKVDYVRVWQQ